MPAFDTAQLTVARRSVWDAITNGSGTGVSVFTQFRLEGDPGLLSQVGPTSRAEIPAVKIVPAKVGNEWASQRYMDYDYVVDVLVYEKTLPALEGSLQKVWEAIITTCPDGSTLPYTRSSMNKPPEQIGSTLEIKRIGKEDKQAIWVGRMTLGLHTTNQPHNPT